MPSISSSDNAGNTKRPFGPGGAVVSPSEQANAAKIERGGEVRIPSSSAKSITAALGESYLMQLFRTEGQQARIVPPEVPEVTAADKSTTSHEDEHAHTLSISSNVNAYDPRLRSPDSFQNSANATPTSIAQGNRTFGAPGSGSPSPAASLLSPNNTPTPRRPPIGHMRNRSSNVRVATYNIFYELYDTGDVLNYAPERLPLIISELEALDADVIALQEVTPWFFHNIRNNSQLLREQYYWTCLPTEVEGSFSQVILSRYPILDAAFLNLNARKRCLFVLLFMHLNKSATTSPEDCIYLVGNVHLKSDYNANLGDNKDVRAAQLKKIFGVARSQLPTPTFGLRVNLSAWSEEESVIWRGYAGLESVVKLFDQLYVHLSDTTGGLSLSSPNGNSDFSSLALSKMPCILLGDFNMDEGETMLHMSAAATAGTWDADFKDVHLATRSREDEKSGRVLHTYDSSRNNLLINKQFPAVRFDRVLIRDFAPVSSGTLRLFGTKPTRAFVPKSRNPQINPDAVLSPLTPAGNSIEVLQASSEAVKLMEAAASPTILKRSKKDANNNSNSSSNHSSPSKQRGGIAFADSNEGDAAKHGIPTSRSMAGLDAKEIAEDLRLKTLARKDTNAYELVDMLGEGEALDAAEDEEEEKPVSTVVSAVVEDEMEEAQSPLAPISSSNTAPNSASDFSLVDNGKQLKEKSARQLTINTENVVVVDDEYAGKWLVDLYPSDHFGVVCNIERSIKTPTSLTPVVQSFPNLSSIAAFTTNPRLTGSFCSIASDITLDHSQYSLSNSNSPAATPAATPTHGNSPCYSAAASRSSTPSRPTCGSDGGSNGKKGGKKEKKSKKQLQEEERLVAMNHPSRRHDKDTLSPPLAPVVSKDESTIPTITFSADTDSSTAAPTSSNEFLLSTLGSREHTADSSVGQEGRFPVGMGTFNASSMVSSPDEGPRKAPNAHTVPPSPAVNRRSPSKRKKYDQQGPVTRGLGIKMFAAADNDKEKDEDSPDRARTEAETKPPTAAASLASHPSSFPILEATEIKVTSATTERETNSAPSPLPPLAPLQPQRPAADAAAKNSSDTRKVVGKAYVSASAAAGLTVEAPSDSWIPLGSGNSPTSVTDALAYQQLSSNSGYRASARDVLAGKNTMRKEKGEDNEDTPEYEYQIYERQKREKKKAMQRSRQSSTNVSPAHSSGDSSADDLSSNSDSDIDAEEKERREEKRKKEEAKRKTAKHHIVQPDGGLSRQKHRRDRYGGTGNVAASLHVDPQRGAALQSPASLPLKSIADGDENQESGTVSFAKGKGRASPATTGANLFKSFATALCIIPPPKLCSQIDILRTEYDKAYTRWMPHITILYPFVHPAKFADALPLLEQAVSKLPPFRVILRRLAVLNEDDPAAKKHVLYIVPEVKTDDLIKLQATVQRIFPQCVRPAMHGQEITPDGFPEFRPHLTIGQIPASATRERNEIFEWFRRHWQNQEFTVSQLHIVMESNVNSTTSATPSPALSSPNSTELPATTAGASAASVSVSVPLEGKNAEDGEYLSESRGSGGASFSDDSDHNQNDEAHETLETDEDVKKAAQTAAKQQPSSSSGKKEHAKGTRSRGQSLAEKKQQKEPVDHNEGEAAIHNRRNKKGQRRKNNTVLDDDENANGDNEEEDEDWVARQSTHVSDDEDTVTKEDQHKSNKGHLGQRREKKAALNAKKHEERKVHAATKKALQQGGAQRKRNGIYEVVHSVSLTGEAEFLAGGAPTMTPSMTPKATPQPPPRMEDLMPLLELELPPPCKATSSSSKTICTAEDSNASAKSPSSLPVGTAAAAGPTGIAAVLPPSALVAAVNHSSILPGASGLSEDSLLPLMVMEETRTAEIYEPTDALERWLAQNSDRTLARVCPTHTSQKGGLYHVPPHLLGEFLNKWRVALIDSDAALNSKYGVNRPKSSSSAVDTSLPSSSQKQEKDGMKPIPTVADAAVEAAAPATDPCYTSSFAPTPFFIEEVRTPQYRLYVDIDMVVCSTAASSTNVALSFAEDGSTAAAPADAPDPLFESIATSYLGVVSAAAGVLPTSSSSNLAAVIAPANAEEGSDAGVTNTTTSSSSYKNLLRQICIETMNMFGVPEADSAALVLHSHGPWPASAREPTVVAKTGYRMYFQRIFVDKATHRRYLTRLANEIRRSLGAVPPMCPSGTTWSDIISDQCAVWERARLLGTVKLRRSLQRQYKFIGIYDAGHEKSGGWDQSQSRVYSADVRRMMFGQMVRVWDCSLVLPKPVANVSLSTSAHAGGLLSASVSPSLGHETLELCSPPPFSLGSPVTADTTTNSQAKKKNNNSSFTSHRSAKGKGSRRGVLRPNSDSDEDFNASSHGTLSSPPPAMHYAAANPAVSARVPPATTPVLKPLKPRDPARDIMLDNSFRVDRYFTALSGLERAAAASAL